MTVAAPPAPALRVGLDPWHEPPDPKAVGLMPAAFWSRHRIVPVALGGDAVVVVSAERIVDAVIGEIRKSTYRDVRALPAADDEVELWLAVAVQGRSWESALIASLQSLARAIGLATRPEVALPRMETRDTEVEVVARAFGLADDAALEVLALRARLPQIRLARYPRPPYLGALLDPAAAERLRVVPVAVHRGLAVVATPRVPGPQTRRALRRAIGLETRIALCRPGEFAAAFAQVYPQATSEVPAAPTADAVFERLVQHRAIAAVRQRALDRIAALTTETRLAAALRLGYVSQADADAAAAQLVGLPPLDDPAPAVDPAAASAPPEFWRSRGCVPVGRSGARLRIATDRAIGAAGIELLRRAAGVAETSAAAVPSGVLDQLLAELPRATPPTYTVEEHLVSAGVVSPERAAATRRIAGRAGSSVVSALRERRLVEADDLAEAAAIAAYRPWVHVERCSPDAFAIDAFDDRAAHATSAVPLARRGGTLLVALMDVTADERRVASATPLQPDLVYGAADAPDAILARWYAPRPRVAEHYAAFGRSLVARGWLSRPQVDLALEDVARGRRIDAVLTGRGRLAPEQLASAIAAHLGCDVVDLEPAERRRVVVDALGVEREEVFLDDPVDHGLARTVPRETALRYDLVPVRRRGDAVVVAFVDPLDQEALAAAAAALGRQLVAAVATRREVEVAQRRVYTRPSVGERLIEAGVITREQLDRALEVHDRTGVRVGGALVSLGYVTALELAAAIAEQSGLPFVDLRAAEPDPAVARLVPHEVARERGVLPIWDEGDAIVVACTEPLDPETSTRLPNLAYRALRPVIVTEAALDHALGQVWRDEYLRVSTAQLLSRSPEDSARWVLSRGQKSFFVLLALGTVAGLFLDAVTTVTAYVALSTLFYVAFSAYKFYLAYRAMGTSLEIEVTPEDLGLLDERELPVYTLLVPVYHEAKVFPILAKAIERLDYPKAKLDVKILLEEDDLETIDVAHKAGLPSWFQLLVVPHGGPQGKPKACNYGLIHARGEYAVIFDAEDIPEPDQLKKAIVAFRKGDARLACVQAKLNYFNRDQNLLTRWFTTEYSMWFDLFLPGLDASRAPIPLGGTSNHFPTARLRELGAWDPYNVTEDADLGMRLYKKGWTTAVIDSTTYEEANSELYNWIRQRSRWVKGYIQTYLVHMRDPLRLYRQVGFRAFLSFQFVVGGTFFGYLVNPLYWLLTVGWFLFHWGIIREIFPTPVFYLGSIGLYLGNFAFTYLNVAGCLRREYYDMVKYALLSPVYWAFMSVAAWKGFLQLFYRPSYWEKTEHGLYRGQIRLRRTPARRAA